jgi:uroporphyrinogen-III synthase
LSNLLENKNIVLTRAKDQAVESIKALEDLGANVISFPTIKISSVNDVILDETLKEINNFNTIIFTSENAVKYFLIKLVELKVNFEADNFFVISIGEKTSTICELNNIKINFQPKKFISEELLLDLSNFDFLGKKIIVPCSSLSDLDQFKILEKFGAQITSIPIYENSTNDESSLLEEIEIINKCTIDLFIFTSPSTFNGFVQIMKIENPKNYFTGKTIAVIGPVTEKALSNFGIKPDIIPDNYSMNFMIEEIKKFYAKELSH